MQYQHISHQLALSRYELFKVAETENLKKCIWSLFANKKKVEWQIAHTHQKKKISINFEQLCKMCPIKTEDESSHQILVSYDNTK